MRRCAPTRPGRSAGFLEDDDIMTGQELTDGIPVRMTVVASTCEIEDPLVTVDAGSGVGIADPFAPIIGGQPLPVERVIPHPGESPQEPPGGPCQQFIRSRPEDRQ